LYVPSIVSYEWRAADAAQNLSRREERWRAGGEEEERREEEEE